MDKMFEIFEKSLENKISKIKLKNALKHGIQNLDKAIDFLKSVDPEKFMDSLAESLKKCALQAYNQGKISEQSLESARRLHVIGPNELTKAIYEFNKAMYEFCEKMKAKEKEET